MHEGHVLSVHDVAHERDIQLRYLFARSVHVGNEIERDVASCQTVEETHALGDRIASPEKVNGIPLATQMRGPFEHYNGNVRPLQPVSQGEPGNPTSRDEHTHTCFLSASLPAVLETSVI